MSQHPIINVIDIHKKFAGHNVLNGISIEISPGSIVSVIGPSGAGKSTLLRCINALSPIDRGSIVVDGLNVHDKHLDQSALHKKVGMVFQQFNLFPHRTVLDNITLAPIHVLKKLRGESEELARHLLDKVCLPGIEGRYPSQLSGGQQQRVAIARSLAMQPKIMLFDEITASLDPEAVKSIQNIIRDLTSDGITCVQATHDMEFAGNVSDYIYFMDNGAMVEFGPPSSVLVNPQTSRMSAFLGHP